MVKLHQPHMGRLLKELRLLKGVSQEQVALRMGIKQASVCSVEGRAQIKLATLRKYADAVGLTLIVELHEAGALP